MKNNKPFVIIIILLVAVAGYFAFKRFSSPNIEETPINTSSQGKLNINVICEGALSYMTFNDGASADKFVAECKEGKYPEVIERYKAQMNLGDGKAV